MTRNEPTAVVPGSDIYDLRETISAAVALGLPVAAPALTHAVEVTIHGWDYDDPDTSLGIYQSHEAAVIALRNWVIERYDEDVDNAPWFPLEDLTDEEIAAERKTYLAGKTDADIIATMFDDSMYYFTDHKVERTPERTM